MTTVHAARQRLTQALQPYSASAAADAVVVLAHLLGRSKAWVWAHPEARLTRLAQQNLQQAVTRLAAGEPLPYVLGEWEFWGRPFRVTPAVLIPRPETEHLIERALALAPPADRRWRVADVGTGSGVLAVTLAAEHPTAWVVATDYDAAALQVARENARRHGVAQRLRWVQTDGLLGVAGPFDVIVANPPYIPQAVLAHLAVARFEPRRALDGGPDGLRWTRAWLSQAASRLAPGGAVLMEIAADQGPAALALARAVFPKARVQVHPDLAGRDRVLEVRCPGPNRTAA